MVKPQQATYDERAAVVAYLQAAYDGEKDPRIASVVYRLARAIADGSHRRDAAGRAAEMREVLK